ncbi:MAG: hypothetical protein WCW68_04425 [Methanothrix sp.]|jgi:hypothetical protein
MNPVFHGKLIDAENKELEVTQVATSKKNGQEMMMQRRDIDKTESL